MDDQYIVLVERAPEEGWESKSVYRRSSDALAVARVLWATGDYWNVRVVEVVFDCRQEDYEDALERAQP